MYNYKSNVVVKEKLQKYAPMSGKSNVSLLLLHGQKYQFVDFIFTDMQNSNEYVPRLPFSRVA